MPFQIVPGEPFTIVGISARVGAHPPAEIGALWQRFFAEQVADRIPDRVGSEIYSLYTAYAGDHTQPYTVVLGARVAGAPLAAGDLPDGTSVWQVAAATYVVLTGIPSTPAAIGAAWQTAWQAALPRTFVCDYDVHHHDGPRTGTVDVYVGVHARDASA